MAQNPVTSTQALKQNLKASGEYFRWSAGPSEVNGSPYLTEEFLSGMIYWNRIWNEGIDLRYNVYQGNFEAKLGSEIIVINPIKNYIDTLKYREEVFVKKYLNVGKDKLVVYLSLLGQQNGYALYKQYRIKLTEAVTDTDLYHEAKPADIRKEGTHFDLPLAIGILAASAQVNDKQLGEYLMLGELSLDGNLVPVRGVLPMVLLAREERFKGVIVPQGNAAEALVVDGIEVVAVSNLKEVVSLLNGKSDSSREPVRQETTLTAPVKYQVDFSEVKGQASVNRSNT